jgi:hypothetical protein
MPTSVGIMSMQRIRNYGSSLQAYGLRRLLESTGGRTQVSFVDYRPGRVLVAEEQPATEREVRSRTRARLSKLSGFRDDPRAATKYLYHRKTYERRFFPLIGLPREPSYGGNFDLLVIGSDEVFNCMQSARDVGYSPDLFGYGSHADRIISYAASFGNTTLDRLRESGVEHEIRDGLRRFERISVRDENSAAIVEYLIGHRPDIHLDPVLMFDFSTLEPRVPKSTRIPYPYVLVYGYSDRFSGSENAAVVQYAKSIDARIVCIGGMQGCCDKYVDCDPFELLAYFRDAQAVVTDTFHGAIFAIINERPFAAIVRESVGSSYGNEEKLGFLLSDLGLHESRVGSSDQIQEVLERPIDYQPVGTRLEHERSRTSEYLAKAVSGTWG